MADKGSFPLSGLRVCIDSMSDGEIRGFFYSPLDKEVYPAYGFEDFTLKADRLFDKYGYPQAYMTGRSFQENMVESNHYHGVPCAVRSREEITSFYGKLATCDIIVESRRKASWQGVVKDDRGGVLGTFECIIDIMKIIKDYLEE